MHVDCQSSYRVSNEIFFWFLQVLEQSVSDHGIEHVILDNLQFMMGSSSSNRMEEKFARQDRFVEKLRGFTTDTGAHLTLVVHPRKIDDDHLLTINSLYGGGKISQEADNILLLQEEIGTALPKKYIQVRYAYTICYGSQKIPSFYRL